MRSKRISITAAIVLAMPVTLLVTSGCTTYRVYSGKKRLRSEVATLAVPWTEIAIDDHPVEKENVSRLEMLPGRHEVEWDFKYPNAFRETERLSFEARPGGRYRLGERFFAAPHPDGLAGAIVDAAVDTAWLPFSLIFPPEPGTEPAAGEYYFWIVDVDTQEVVAGEAPNVPRAHAAITYVPVDEE